MGLSLVTGPALDPVSLAEAKAHCRVFISDDDGLIAGYVLAARQYLEEITGRALISQTWDYTIDEDWPWVIDENFRHRRLIRLPKAPLVSVTSISYVDAAGATQTLAPSEYVVDTSNLGGICAAYGVTWPAVRCQPNAITVRFVTGHGSNPGGIPEPLRQAILLLVSHWYENREAVTATAMTDLPMGVAALIAPYRIYGF